MEYRATMKIVHCVRFTGLLIAITVGSICATALPAQEYVRDSRPKLFSYDELVQLSLDQEMPAELGENLRLITTTPFVNNEAYLSGARPRPLEVPGLGPSLRWLCGTSSEVWSSITSNSF